MNDRHSIPTNEIVVLPQPRKVFRGIEQLADDIREHGLLQPITITPSKRLVYGERRYRACCLLKLERVDVLYTTQELAPDEILERQIAENVARDDLTWQERALALLDIHTLKRQRGALEGWKWGQREAAALFQMELSTVNYVLRVATKLREEELLPEGKRKYWNFQSANEAFRLGLLAEREDKLNAELARRAQVVAEQHKAEVQKQVDVLLQDITSAPLPTEDTKRAVIVELRTRAKGNYLDLSKDEARELYLANPKNPPDQFEVYYTEKTSQYNEFLTVDLSSVALNVDCLDFMSDVQNAGRFDHIITDPPYGIDMSNLDQENIGMVNIASVQDEHQVDKNMELLTAFFGCAYFCTKETAFVIVCGDVMQWQLMYNAAANAGFAVQRWPIIWRKVNQSCMNFSASYNTTKDFEIAMVCRKPGATLAKKRSSSIVDASNTEVVKLTGHPFAKPFELTHEFVDLVSQPNQLILEPFAGRGSMALEILRQGRRVIALEKDVAHFNALLENLKQHYYLRLNSRFKFKQ